MSLTIQVTGLKPVSQKLAAAAIPLKKKEGVLRVMSRAGVNLLKAHFRKRNTVPNKLGGRRTNFWQQVADSVNDPRIGGDTATIAISDSRFRQKVQGGTITPKRAKALTIPVHPAAHGVAASVLESEIGTKLFLLKKADDGTLGVLAARLGSSKDITVFYVLRSSVTQAADKDALPDQLEFTRAVGQAGDDYIAVLLGKK